MKKANPEAGDGTAQLSLIRAFGEFLVLALARFPAHNGGITAPPMGIIGDENANSRSRLSANRMEQTMQRRHFKDMLSFPDPSAHEAERLREEAEKLPPGHEREMLLREARQANTASHIDEWLTSPGLKEPT
jgi:hypothetical protein